MCEGGGEVDPGYEGLVTHLHPQSHTGEEGTALQAQSQGGQFG